MTFDQIKRATAEHFNIYLSDLTGPSRETQIVRPRMLAMSICRYELLAPYPAIGRAFGGRHHKTAMNAVDRMDYFLANPPVGENYKMDYETIMEELNQMRDEKRDTMRRGKQWVFTSTRKVADTVN